MKLIDGIPCNNPGCLSHVTHPCETCGRIAGRRNLQSTQQENTMIEVDFTDAKVGDVVLDLKNGWIKVEKVRRERSMYPIVTSGMSYTSHGRLFKEDKYPTLFLKDQVPPELLKLYGPPPGEFKKGDRVLVRSSIDRGWSKRYFSHMEGEKYMCFCHGKDERASEGRTTDWEYCKKWEG